MSCTVAELMAICEEALRLNVKYVYGAKWQVLSAAQINNLRNLYGSNCVWPSDNSKAGHLCCDCSGLISKATGTVRGSAQYKETARKVLPISQRQPGMKGWAVWMRGHIGVYDGNNGYYAMDGSARNMVHYPLSKNNFTHIIQLCDVDYGSGVVNNVDQIPVPSGGHYNNEIKITYAAMLPDGRQLPEVVDLTDYAGIRGAAIIGLKMKVNIGSLWYQVYTDHWLPKVTGCDWNDYNNGYAGNRKPIKAVRAYYNTPADVVKKQGYMKLKYAVSPMLRDYYDWQYDNETSGGQDGYAGDLRNPIDRIKMDIV